MLQQYRFVLAKLILTATAFLMGANCFGSTQPEDIFNCSRALYDAGLVREDGRRDPGEKGRSFRIASLPVGQPTQAYVVSLGRLWHTREGHAERHGAFAPGIAIVTRDGLNCHRLAHPEVEHGAGNIYETYAFKLAYPRSESSASFDIILHRDRDSGKFLDSKVTAPERRAHGTRKRLTPHSCLDPRGVEVNRLLNQLARMADLRTHALDSETNARRDIRIRGAAEPGPAFEPRSDVVLSQKARKICRKIANKELDQALDRYEHAVRKFDSNERHGPRPKHTRALE